MSIMEWGALGEIIGAIAVVVTLIYLARQIRLNTQSLRAAAKHNATRAQLDYFDTLLHDPELRRTYRRGLKDFQELDAESRDVFGMLMYKSFFTFSEAYYQYRHAHFDEAQWLESREAIDWHLARSGARAWWHDPRRRRFPDDFTRMVEERLQAITENGNTVARKGKK